MKMKALNYFLFIILAYTIFACTSGKQSYKQGDYYQSVVQSVERLRKNPDHKKSRETLAQSYPLAVQYYENQIQRYLNSNDQFKHGNAVDYYRRLAYLYDEIMRCPGALQVIPNPRDYNYELNQFSRQAAAERYTAGEESLKMGTRQAAKDAYFHFAKADDYSPGYLDVIAKMDEAKYYATLKVLVDQVPVPTINYQLSVQFFQDQIEQFLFNYQDNEFVRFYAKQDENLRDPDQIIVFQFDDFVVGQTNNFQKTEEITKDSIVVGQVTLESGEKADVFGTAKAKYVENRREVISRGLLSMRVIDARSNTVMTHEKFPGEFVWTTKWGSFNGDERALDKEQVKIANLKPVMPPPPQDLFVEFCKPIYGQVQGKVRSMYRNM
jgi:hypothetical protein